MEWRPLGGVRGAPGEAVEGADAVAAAGAAETPRDRSDRGDRGGRGRGRGGPSRGARRTTYVPPGAPPMPEPVLPDASEGAETKIASEVAPAAETEHPPGPGEGEEQAPKAETAEASE